ncbi:MAG: hypothetical protein KDK37_05470, partial [Leptospiraceae bacterium]|nr:hypothetical protein [Leptospiraceae bacterium]
MPAQSDILNRIPRFKDAWLPFYRSILENSHAPRWNAQCGDRLIEQDIPALNDFVTSLGRTENGHWSDEQQDRWRRKFSLLSPWIRSALETSAPTMMQREDLRLRMHEIVPLNADLNRLVLNPTSGTTGMPVEVPNDPVGVATYQPLILEALGRHGVSLDLQGKMAAVQICSQRDTMTYGTVHSFYEGAGFAKINIPPGGEESILRHWRHSGDIQAFLEST